MDYKDGKAYREALGARPSQPSTAPDRGLGYQTVTHHLNVASPHKETVGYTPGGFVHPTHPNAGSEAHGNSGTNSDASLHGPLNRAGSIREINRKK